MSEWWTYRLSDFLMFESRTYYRLFELYNRDLWPVQIVALLLGFTLLALAWRGGVMQGRIAAAILVVAWLWVGWAFHWRRYATIDLASRYFAVAFAIQALLLLLPLVRPPRSPQPQPPDRVGLALVLFAVVLQPLIGPLLGRSWAAIELFGLAPDPTAVASLGVLLVWRKSWGLFVIPLVWCVVTGATLWAMAAPDAWVAPLVAGVATVQAFRGRRSGVGGTSPRTARGERA